MNTTPLDEVQWQSPEWIQAFGLYTDNVLDYFSESPFFNKTSSNQSIRMQRQFQADANGAGPGAGQGPDMLGVLDPHHNETDKLLLQHVRDPERRAILTRYPVHAQLERQLAKVGGIEYVLAHVREPDLWVIRKQRRDIQTMNTSILQTYYVMGPSVYQAPSIHALIESRLLAASTGLEKTMVGLRKLARFEPAQGRYLVRNGTVTSSSSTVSESGGSGKTVPNTGPATGSNGAYSIPGSGFPGSAAPGTTVAGQTAGGTAQFESNRRPAAALSTSQLDKLLAVSFKARPEYI
ncbi:hypothetical protein TBLA_0A02960 [Henningerozyma blattae CBS 6284]|uniref:Mediator of RNA polymerase II transcription subunit 6 n=1 Tax=Henningerozyma blattae (strain ATCC 34711 / CBS 6284 / DSM 70876 / NBRC 10599 / NRRL Y-10934 / UCD 77-7) TaxID=1071380 RepID=I2GVE4_HENB6|nr:hypothetical protein TBLA_0A02960 [Tetrapisispora blattae CBS 6284]CCH58096.1 hypothetical protein TBLA_0A02960 [Tetrapisispora blattae CBS 6284]